MNYLALVVAAVAAFVASSVYYIVFSKQVTKLRTTTAGATADIRRPPAWKVGAELFRNLILASVVAQVLALAGVANWIDGAGLGVLLWIGFPFVLLTGSAMWESVSWKLAAIHTGDWLVKLLLMAVVLSVWR
jgi:uncharacterized protein DUF1761